MEKKIGYIKTLLQLAALQARWQILLKGPMKLFLSCDLILYFEAFPSETGRQSDLK